MDNKGFTLIEILILGAFIGILATIAMPQFAQYREKVRRRSAVMEKAPEGNVSPIKEYREKRGNDLPKEIVKPLSRIVKTHSQTVKARSARIDDYLESLRKGSYTFNPPSPVKVAKPITVYFWLDPSATTDALKEALLKEIKKVSPDDPARIEAGITKWSPNMEASLKGDNFKITPITNERQTISSKERTDWRWSITPKQPGRNHRIYLTLNVVLPPVLGEPRAITVLERSIDVDVSYWWLLDHYFDKYWKWLLTGLATTVSGIVVWWWNTKHNIRKSMINRRAVK